MKSNKEFVGILVLSSKNQLLIMTAVFVREMLKRQWTSWKTPCLLSQRSLNKPAFLLLMRYAVRWNIAKKDSKAAAIICRKRFGFSLFLQQLVWYFLHFLLSSVHYFTTIC